MVDAENSLNTLLTARFRAQAQLAAALTDHPVLVGAGRESALGALLQELLPRRFEVLTGIIAQLDAQGRPSRASGQADLLVVDTLDYPVLLRTGTSAVVLPDAVRAIVEVKSALARPPAVSMAADVIVAEGTTPSPEEDLPTAGAETFLDALAQIGRLRLAVRDAGPRLFTVLFSYGAPVFPKKLREWLVTVFAGRATAPPGIRAALLPDALPNLIVSLSGALAVKSPTADRYSFLRCPADGRKDGSAAVETVAQVLAAVAAAVPGDQTSVGRGFAFMRAFLTSSVGVADGCADLVL